MEIVKQNEQYISIYRGIEYITIWQSNDITYFLNEKPYKTIKGVFNAIDKQKKKKSIENFLKNKFDSNG